MLINFLRHLSYLQQFDVYIETYEPVHTASVALRDGVVTCFFQKRFFIQSLPEKQLGTFFFSLNSFTMSSVIVSSVKTIRKGLQSTWEESPSSRVCPSQSQKQRGGHQLSCPVDPTLYPSFRDTDLQAMATQHWWHSTPVREAPLKGIGA